MVNNLIERIEIETSGEPELRNFVQRVCGENSELAGAIINCTVEAYAITPPISELVNTYCTLPNLNVKYIGSHSSVPYSDFLAYLKAAEKYVDDSSPDMAEIEALIYESNEQTVTANPVQIKSLTIVSITDKTDMYIWSVGLLDETYFSVRIIDVVRDLVLNEGQFLGGTWEINRLKRTFFCMYKQTETSAWELVNLGVI